MTDNVKRPSFYGVNPVPMYEAADEIERLQALRALIPEVIELLVNVWRDYEPEEYETEIEATIAKLREASQ